MKIIYWAVFISLLMLISGCAQKVNNPGDVQAIKGSVDEYNRALNARDADAAVAAMTDKTHFADSNETSLAGKEAVRQKLRQDFQRLARYDVQFSSAVADVQVSGNLGTARGYWTMKARDKEDALAPVNDSGSFALICLRQGDGSWKWDSVTLNNDQPAPGSTTDGSDEQALMQIESDMTGAMARADTSELERMLAREPAAGAEPAQRKAQPLGGQKKAFQLESMKVKDVKPHVFGDAALVTMKGEMKGTYNGQEVSGTLQGVDFFVKRDGQWQVVYSQNTSTIP